MTSMELFELLGSVRDSYVLEAHGSEAVPAGRISLRKILLVAAIIALSLLLVGCTYAYVQGWFTALFATRSEEPLSSEQVEYIQENEQILQQSQAKSGWTVELKSTICDGDTGYMLFRVTAPEDIDLEGYHAGNYEEAYITPANNSAYSGKNRATIVASTGFLDEEKNFIWQGGGGKGGWQADHDGLPNTMDYLLGTKPEKLYPDREMLLEDPFGPDVEFKVRFDGFSLEYEDPEVQKKIDEKYAGMTDYMVEDEDLIGLHKSDLLVEETWEFTITFAEPRESVELITGEPIQTWGIVTWKLDDEPTFFQTGSGMAAVTVKSFLLNPFGARITYEFEEPAFDARIEYQDAFGYEDRYVYAVMKNGSRIALHTDGTGDQLTAEAPIVLSEVDHILLGSGEKLYMPQ